MKHPVQHQAAIAVAPSPGIHSPGVCPNCKTEHGEDTADPCVLLEIHEHPQYGGAIRPYMMSNDMAQSIGQALIAAAASSRAHCAWLQVHKAAEPGISIQLQQKLLSAVDNALQQIDQENSGQVEEVREEHPGDGPPCDLFPDAPKGNPHLN